MNDVLRRPTALKALLILREKGPMTLSALARELGTNRARLGKYLKELVKEGYVEEELLGGVRVYKLKTKIEL